MKIKLVLLFMGLVFVLFANSLMDDSIVCEKMEISYMSFGIRTYANIDTEGFENIAHVITQMDKYEIQRITHELNQVTIPKNQTYHHDTDVRIKIKCICKDSEKIFVIDQSRSSLEYDDKNYAIKNTRLVGAIFEGIVNSSLENQFFE